jgi:hypothetical protein
VTKPKTVLGWSPGEDVGFKDKFFLNFFYHIQRFMPNDQACEEISGSTDWQEV